jgi:hypothetical protein
MRDENVKEMIPVEFQTTSSTSGNELHFLISEFIRSLPNSLTDAK